MEAKHTPGPWRFDNAPFGRHVLAGDGAVCMVSTRNAESNAHLIAAAPELLAAVQFAHRELVNMTTEDFRMGADHAVREALIAAIARATGGEQS